jgi:methylglutaconyl-CoA hydratase
MKTYNTIEVSTQNFMATVWLNRPAAQNAITNEMLDELIHIFNSLEKENSVRVIVLRGKGKSFSAGADLNRMLESSKLNFDENLKDGQRWADCLGTIYNSPKPTIAVATGNNYGGGIGLLCASDIVIAEENAEFSFSEVKIGLAPSTIMPYVLTRLNEHKAKYLMFTGQKVGATEAQQLNLVDVIVPTYELESRLKSISNDIIKASPEGIKETKRLIGELKNAKTHDEIVALTSSSIAKLKISNEANEGISAFFDKRPPIWSAKE